jgi:hypothetical protein
MHLSISRNAPKEDQNSMHTNFYLQDQINPTAAPSTSLSTRGKPGRHGKSREKKNIFKIQDPDLQKSRSRQEKKQGHR